MRYKNNQETLKNGMTCDYCNAHKEKVVFAIGAARVPDWCMVEGTGNITCPDCYQKAMLAGQAAIDAHCAAHGYNRKAVQA